MDNTESHPFPNDGKDGAPTFNPSYLGHQPERVVGDVGIAVPGLKLDQLLLSAEKTSQSFTDFFVAVQVETTR